MLHSKRPIHFTLWAFSLALLATSVTGQVEASSQSGDAQPGEQIIANYFQYQVKQIESGWLQGIETLDDWRARREHLRRELLEMLGLSPLPQRTDLKVTITGTVETEDFIVEKLHYQSMPGLYVTANLYRPKQIKQNIAIAILAARGIGPTAWDTKRETHLRRRFVLLGQTLDGMRVWDVRRTIAVLSTIDELEATPLHLRGRGTMAGVLLYASLFEPAVQRLDLWSLPPTHREGPIFLNVLRFFDMPQALAMALTNTRVVLHDTDPQAWTWPHKLAENLSLASAFQIED